MPKLNNFIYIDSTFLSNKPILFPQDYKDNDSYELKRIYEFFKRILGGAINCKSQELFINSNKFIENEANTAGAIMITKNPLGNQTLILIANSSFFYNKAGPQASSIQFFNDLVGLTAFILNSSFKLNDARCKGKFINH